MIKLPATFIADVPQGNTDDSQRVIEASDRNRSMLPSEPPTLTTIRILFMPK